MKYLYTIIAVLCSVVLASTSCAHAQVARSIERVVYYTDTASARKSLQAHIDSIGILAPQSYGFDGNLAPYGSVPENVLSLTAAHHVPVMPLVVNEGFKQDIIHHLLASTSSMDRLIDFLTTEGQAHGFYGWQFDIEHISADDRDAYSAFVERAATRLHTANLILSVAVVVQTDTSTTSDWYRNWAGAFDYARLTKSADFLSVMTYDDPNSVGPTASLPFVHTSLDTILASGTPADKISLGIPAYYWSWQTSPDRKRVRSGTYARLLSLRSTTRHTEGFDNNLGVSWLKFREHGKSYAVWYEDARSFRKKLALLQDHGLRGYSLWALGMEDPKMWK